MRSIYSISITIAIFILIEYLAFYAIHSLIRNINKKYKRPIYVGYILISLSMIILLILFNKINFEAWHPIVKSITIASFLGFYAGKLIIALFTILNFLYIAFQWFRKATLKNKKIKSTSEVKVYEVSRSRFLSYAGVGIGSLMFGTLINGVRNKYNYVLKKNTIPIKDLPKGLESLKIIQISDIHAGSFDNIDEVQKGMDLIMEQQPDLIVFTGDIVNNVAEELEPYIEVFKSLKAPLGVYSVLGNHDYGDYVKWNSDKEKADNLDKLKRIQKEIGWQLLNNEYIELNHAGEKFNLIGVENWSAKSNFPKHGLLQQSTENVNKDLPLSILLSHDPSHWDKQVRKSTPFIDLTLSGHTHGMQFGVRLPFMKWSPVQFMYDQWAGLYTKKNQHLYVNVGFGFLGYPGRVGIMPEVTEIKFKRA